MCDDNVDKDYRVSEVRKRYMKRDLEDRPQVLESQITCGTKDSVVSRSYLMRFNSLHLSSME